MGAVGIVQLRDPGGHAGGDKYLGSDCSICYFFGCAGSQLLCEGFLSPQRARSALCCGAQAPLAAERRLCGPQAQ